MSIVITPEIVKLAVQTKTRWSNEWHRSHNCVECRRSSGTLQEIPTPRRKGILGWFGFRESR